jgi:hypothetical protein
MDAGGLFQPILVGKTGQKLRTLRDAFDRWKDALIDQDKQTTPPVRLLGQPAEVFAAL